MKRVFIFSCLLILATSGFAQAEAKSNKALKAEYRRLMDNYYKEQAIFNAPLEKLSTFEEMAQVKLDASKAPSKRYLPQFKAIARRAEKMGDKAFASEVWLFIFVFADNGGLAGDDPKTQAEAFEVMTTRFVDTPMLEYLATYMRSSYYRLGDQRVTTAEAKLAQISKVAKSDDVRAAVLIARAAIIKDNNGPKSQSLALLDTVLERYPKSKLAASAQMEIYEIVHLSVGCTAPDFEAEDENGVKFKLTDYRGKVIVLEFWGFW